MKELFDFVGSNKRLLNFGFLFNFFSSFGQTFFISLFVPFWVELLNISNTLFGGIYAGATILSAVLLSFTGRFIDRMPLRTFGLIAFTGLMSAVFILSQVYNIYILAVGLLFVRWFGQGLMTHASSTGMAIYFDKNRGKSLGFTALGHPAGQFVFPLLFITVTAVVGWRFGLLVMGLLSVLIAVPSILAIKPVTSMNSFNNQTFIKSQKHNRNIFADAKFWILALNATVIPFICTAVFLYQYNLVDLKGWDASWIATSFAYYAIVYAASLLFAGFLVDKFTGFKLFPLYLIPTFIGLLIVALIDSKWSLLALYALLGFSTGLGTTVNPATHAEVYGVSMLGKVRSYFITILVLSTALAPPLFGYFFDNNFSFNHIMLGTAVFVLGVIVLSFSLWKSFKINSADAT